MSRPTVEEDATISLFDSCVKPETDALGSLQALLDDLKQIFEKEATHPDLAPGTSAWKMMERFVQIAKQVSSKELESILNEDSSLFANRAWFAPLYGAYISKKEAIDVVTFLAEIEKAGTFDRNSLTDWGASAYQRVRDLFEGKVDLSNRQHLIMVGSGPLPVTLIHIHERTSIPKLTAVDVDLNALGSIAKLKSILGWNRLDGQHKDGLLVDYRDADFIYIANLVSSKKAILEVIVHQVMPGTLVVVRDAVGIGKLFAESVQDSIPLGLQLIGFGDGDKQFHSHHMFLVKDS